MKQTDKQIKPNEQLLQKERDGNPTGNFKDQIQNTQHASPNVNGMSLKEIGTLILLLLIGFGLYVVYKLIY